jgi:hypothetical protein
MPIDDALLFIDANKYLDLYRTVHGKKLLAPLGEQADHIFVTQQVVEEVHRNKILVAAGFLNDKFKELKLQTFPVPDHLFGTSGGQNDSIRAQMSAIIEKIRQVNKEVDALAIGIMEQISRSQDEVSKALAPIFAKAVPHSPAELQRARERRERGNPPGKSTNPIGDQLTWEQILTRFTGKKRIWIIARDGDYGTFHDTKGFLNHFLYEELRKITSDVEALLFEDIVEGIKHFADTTGVKADKLPTPEETEEIKKEEAVLTPLDWMGNSMEVANEMISRAHAQRTRQPIHQIVQPIIVPSVPPLQYLQVMQPIISRSPLPPQAGNKDDGDEARP